jgi:membrane protein DedA with SNARE-associated domain
MLPITFIYVYLGFKLGARWEDVAGLANTYILPIGLAVLAIYLIYKFTTMQKKKALTKYKIEK